MKQTSLKTYCGLGNWSAIHEVQRGNNTVRSFQEQWGQEEWKGTGLQSYHGTNWLNTVNYWSTHSTMETLRRNWIFLRRNRKLHKVCDTRAEIWRLKAISSEWNNMSKGIKLIRENKKQNHIAWVAKILCLSFFLRQMMISKAQNSICSIYCPLWKELQNQSFGSHARHSPNCQGVEDKELPKLKFVCQVGSWQTQTPFFLQTFVKNHQVRVFSPFFISSTWNKFGDFWSCGR